MALPIPPRFSTSLATDDIASTVAVEGELDLETAPAFDAAVEEALATGRSVVVDFTACTFMDSTGLQRVLRHREAASRSGQGFALAVTPQGAVDRLIELVAPGLFLHAPTAGEARGLVNGRR
jgi:anti-sigma B factor antagonist